MSGADYRKAACLEESPKLDPADAIAWRYLGIVAYSSWVTASQLSTGLVDASNPMDSKQFTSLRHHFWYWFCRGIPTSTWFHSCTLQDDFTQVTRQGVAVVVVRPSAPAFAQQYSRNAVVDRPPASQQLKVIFCSPVVVR